MTAGPRGHGGPGRDGDDVGTVAVTNGAASEWLIQSPEDDFLPEISPDGDYIAYTTIELGQTEIIVRPFPNVEDGRWQVPQGGLSPVWGPDGRELFYRRPADGAMMRMPISRESTLTPGTPGVLFTELHRRMNRGNGRPWDIDPNGERFLMLDLLAVSQTEGEIHVILNWHQELLERVPVD